MSTIDMTDEAMEALEAEAAETEAGSIEEVDGEDVIPADRSGGCPAGDVPARLCGSARVVVVKFKRIVAIAMVFIVSIRFAFVNSVFVGAVLTLLNGTIPW